MMQLKLWSSWREAAEWLLFVWAWLTGLSIAVIVLGLPVWTILYLIFWALT